MLLKNKRFSLIFLAVLALIGSFITFYTTNLVMHDIANNFYGLQDAGVVISFSSFIFSLDFVLATLFFIRIYRRPEYKKAIIKHYSLLLGIFSCIGLVLSILTGAVMYKDFFAPHPFPGYTIICVVFNALLLALSIAVRFFLVKKLPDDASKRKLNARYVWYTVLLSFMTWFAYNRFGALLWAPIYVQLRTLGITWPFYIYLTLPMLWLVHVVLRMFDKSKKLVNTGLFLSMITLLLNVVLGFAVFLIGATHTEFIAAISPALGLERLASLPIDMILQFGFGTGLSIYEVIYAIRMASKYFKD